MHNLKVSIICLIIIIISAINIHSQDTTTDTKKEDVVFKRHFFDVALVGGIAFVTQITQSYYNDEYKGETFYLAKGGLIGLSLGYLFALTENDALGGGLSGFVSIVQYDSELQKRFGVPAYLNANSSGFAAMILFMIGDLKYNKIAFLLDIGGG